MYICVDNGVGKAIVLGEKAYEIEFELRENRISKLVCSCYCVGECKHEFAVLLQLRDCVKSLENEANWPNVTASRTGIINPVRILSDYGMKLDKACYVSRTYITKHGAGRLANEDSSIANRYEIEDQTNITNKWQGSIRFASFEDKYELRDNIKEDLKDLSKNIKCDLYLTHLNETNNAILVNDKEIKLEEFMDEKNRELFDKIHLSNTKFSKDIHEHILLL